MMNKIFFSLLLIVCSFSMAVAQDISLPAPQKTGGKPLMEALNLRQSHREFSEKRLEPQTLSNLLWAANGFNRPDKRVAPTANNKQELELYVALQSGIYFYDAKAHKLILKVKGDHQSSFGKQAFVATAPVNFAFVADLNKASREMALIDAGYISQNIYLFSASEELNTVVRGLFDKAVVHKLLGLSEKEEVIITQTVGYKK